MLESNHGGYLRHVRTYGMGCLHCLSFWHSSCDLDQPVRFTNMLNGRVILLQA